MIQFFLKATHKWVFYFGFTYYILTSHLVLGLYFTLILKIFISDGRIDDNFLEKNLCHSRDSYHKSPVFRTGALTAMTQIFSQKLSSICPSDIKIFNINWVE